jgi:hypothetical protein
MTDERRQGYLNAEFGMGNAEKAVGQITDFGRRHAE